MSVRSERVYRIECDKPGCELVSRSSAASAQWATHTAKLWGWVQVDLGKRLCPKHRNL